MVTMGLWTLRLLILAAIAALLAIIIAHPYITQ